MIIVYAQAGTRFERFIASTLQGHASLALTGLSPAVFLSYVVEGRREYKHDQFKKGGWSDPLYRVQLPSHEDNCGSSLSEAAILRWYNKKKDKNFVDCVAFTRRALKAGGVLAYHPHYWNPVTPGFLAVWAAIIQHKMKRSGDIASMPAEPDPGNGRFFMQDACKGQNLLPAFIVAAPPSGGVAKGLTGPLVQQIGEDQED